MERITVTIDGGGDVNVHDTTTGKCQHDVASAIAKALGTETADTDKEMDYAATRTDQTVKSGHST